MLAWKTYLAHGVSLVNEALVLSDGAPRVLRADCKTP